MAMAIGLNLARALDPCGVAVEVGISPDDWQRDLLTLIPHRALLNCCRQSGKSTTAALLALHRALFEPRSLVLLVSPSFRQSVELFRKVTEFFHALGGDTAAVQENKSRIEFENGSRVVSLPGSEGTIRGFSRAHLVVIDEAARVSDELVAAVRPTLATTNGDLVCMSTPWGKRGFFYREWTFGGDTWTRFTLRAEDCPRISAEFLAEERRAHGEFIYSQEYECRFIEPESSLFLEEVVRGALVGDEEFVPIFGSR